MKKIIDRIILIYKMTKLINKFAKYRKANIFRFPTHCYLCKKTQIEYSNIKKQFIIKIINLIDDKLILLETRNYFLIKIV